jgi:hypothetical protein
MNLLERFKVFLDTQGLLVASERELIYGNPLPHRRGHRSRLRTRQLNDYDAPATCTPAQGHQRAGDSG